ncbi:MAG: hypothetical protein IMY71_13865 [Bacteroidetes bacterium]|nr:hypothetical protein [Bacteroidota bacterium]
MNRISRLKSALLFLLHLILLLFFINNTFNHPVVYGGNAEVKLNYCEKNKFKLTTGDYTVEFNEETKDMILISHWRAWGMLGLCLLAEDPNSNLLNSIEHISSNIDENKITIHVIGDKSWAEYKLTLFAYKNYPGLLRWHLQIKPKEIPLQIITNRELLPLFPFHRGLTPVKPSEFITGNFPSYFYAKQVPFAAPLIYMISKEWWYGSLFYFEDLTSLNKMFEITATGAKKHMVDFSTSENSFGYQIPEETLKRLPKDQEVTITDSYLYLLDRWPSDEPDLALTFLYSISTVYDFIDKPNTELTDWQDLAHREIADMNHPRIWVTVEGQPYLRAYVADKRTSAELISQLDVLLALKKYEIKYGGVQELIDKLIKTLPSFYSKKFKAVTNDFPNKGKGDSWYFVEEMTQLAKLAKLGEPIAHQLLFASTESMITLAHNVDYDFPVFFSFNDLKATKGSEPDVCGGYAYLMLELFDLTDDNRYLQEAKRAIQHIRGKAFSLNYEMQMTAMAATAAARLYKLTKDSSYIKMSYMPLANIIQTSWLWECNYGYAKHYSTFFGLSPMRYAGVITIKEQYETWIYIMEYLRLVHGEIPEYVEKLLSEFCRYTLYTLRYTMPPLLPSEMIELKPHEWEGVDENIPSLYFPIEDLREGRSKSGQIGQQLYGSGGPITFATESYVEIKPGVTVYSEYPIVWHNGSNFTFAGIPANKHWVEILTQKDIQVLSKKGEQIDLNKVDERKFRFRAFGGETYKIVVCQ